MDKTKSPARLRQEDYRQPNLKILTFQRALFALTIGVPSKLAVPVQLIEVLLGMRPNLGPTSRLHYALDHLPVLAVLA